MSNVVVIKIARYSQIKNPLPEIEVRGTISALSNLFDIPPRDVVALIRSCRFVGSHDGLEDE